MPTIQVTIASGQQVSGVADLSKQSRLGGLVGIFAPVVTSADLAIRASYDGSSAFFVRMQQPPAVGGANSGDLRWKMAAGSMFLPWPQDIAVPANIQLETPGVAQAVPAVFQVLFR